MKNHKNGFTLLELLIVLVIVAILAAVMIPLSMGLRNKHPVSDVQKGWPSNLHIRACIGTVITPGGMATGIVTEVYGSESTWLEVLPKEKFVNGTWERALKAKFVCWNQALDCFEPMDSVEVE